MTITCPHCGFARDFDPDRMPRRIQRVTCPRCQETFSFDRAQAEGTAPDEDSLEGLFVEEPAASSFPREEPAPLESSEGPAQGLTAAAPGEAESARKGGFWIRLAANLLDNALLGVTLMMCRGLLMMAGLASGASLDNVAEGPVAVAISLFGMVFTLAYFVFFTGYGGQTPGKMALRLKVIRTDGGAVGFGRAFLREVIGKFFSAVLLMAGYLMVAFHPQKQGLHDKMAGTYVVKI